MSDENSEVEKEQEIEPIMSDDIDIEVMLAEEENAIYVKFTGFEDTEDAEDYAANLAEILPLRLFETHRMQ